MSVQNQIKQDWQLAMEKSVSKKGFDYDGKVRIAIDSSGNEYFIKPHTEDEKTFRVTTPCGINATVWKKGFRTRWVDESYVLKPLS
jgi:hypothetical protein